MIVFFGLFFSLQVVFTISFQSYVKHKTKDVIDTKEIVRDLDNFQFAATYYSQVINLLANLLSLYQSR